MVRERASGAAADEGTRAHEVLEAHLRHQFMEGGGSYPDCDEEMLAAVQVAVDFVGNILADYPDAVILVEHPFEIPIAAAPGEVWGTCDVVIFVPSIRLLYVIDYKHGAGVFVPVKGNKQLRFYGLGALASLTPQKGRWAGEVWGHQFDTVALVIVQPRCSQGDPIREEWLPVADLLEFGKEIGAAVAAAKAPDAPLVPGEEQCRFCPAKVACPARQQQALAVAGASFADVTEVGALSVPAAVDLTNDEIADILACRALVTSWFGDVADEAHARMRAGGVVRGHKLVETQARREWEDDGHEAAKKLGEIAGKAPDVFMARKLRGLMEVEAILKKDVDKTEARRRLDAMAYLTTKKSSGKLTIAPESDPRPAAGVAGSSFADVQLVEVKQENGA